MFASASCCGHVSMSFTASTIQLPPARIPVRVAIVSRGGKRNAHPGKRKKWRNLNGSLIVSPGAGDELATEPLFSL
jgi:hypothetical protein